MQSPMAPFHKTTLSASCPEKSNSMLSIPTSAKLCRAQLTADLGCFRRCSVELELGRPRPTSAVLDRAWPRLSEFSRGRQRSAAFGRAQSSSTEPGRAGTDQQCWCWCAGTCCLLCWLCFCTSAGRANNLNNRNTSDATITSTSTQRASWLGQLAEPDS